MHIFRLQWADQLLTQHQCLLQRQGLCLPLGRLPYHFHVLSFLLLNRTLREQTSRKKATSGNSNMHNKRDSDTCCKSMFSSMVGIYSFLVMSRNGGMQSGAVFMNMCFILSLKYVPLNVKLLRFPVSIYSGIQSWQKIQRPQCQQWRTDWQGIDSLLKQKGSCAEDVPPLTQFCDKRVIMPLVHGSEVRSTGYGLR